jgi:hypothetical protein
MASSGIEIWCLKNAPARSIKVEFLSVGVLQGARKEGIFLEAVTTSHRG